MQVGQSSMALPFLGIRGFVPRWLLVFLQGYAASSPWRVYSHLRDGQHASQRDGKQDWASKESETGFVVGTESQAKEMREYVKY